MTAIVKSKISPDYYCYTNCSATSVPDRDDSKPGSKQSCPDSRVHRYHIIISDNYTRRSDFVYALHYFYPENVDEVAFKAGDRIEVVEKSDNFRDDWWQVRPRALLIPHALAKLSLQTGQKPSRQLLWAPQHPMIPLYRTASLCSIRSMKDPRQQPLPRAQLYHSYKRTQTSTTLRMLLPNPLLSHRCHRHQYAFGQSVQLRHSH